MLQAVDQNVLSVYRRMLQLFYLDVAYVFTHICCNRMLQTFQLFQSYVAVSVFHAAFVLSGCCICFTNMLQEIFSIFCDSIDQFTSLGNCIVTLLNCSNEKSHLSKMPSRARSIASQVTTSASPCQSTD
jgi:hypothetical protein